MRHLALYFYALINNVSPGFEGKNSFLQLYGYSVTQLTLLHTERPKLYTILAFLSAIGLSCSLSDFSLKLSARVC